MPKISKNQRPELATKAVKVVRYEKPFCGYCGAGTRHMNEKPRWRVCENGHKKVMKKG